jgi:glycerophosphoryl diester phosphodiesterase
MVLALRPPIIVHHMAALHGSYPPNSLEAIRACLEIGAPFVEIDVTAFAHDDYLLVHDPELSSETSGTGQVGKATVAQIRSLFIKHNGVQTDYPVPLLGDVVALFMEYDRPTRLQIDYKDVIPFANDEPLHRLLHLIQPLGERVIVSTGADWQLRRLRKLASWLDLGFDVGFYLDWRQPNQSLDPRIPPFKQGAYGYWDDHVLASQRFWSTAEYLTERCEILTTLVPRVSTFYIDHLLLAQSLDDGFNWAEALHSYGIKLDAWTLDADNPIAATNARRLYEAGVDQFTTNTPAALSMLLDGKHRFCLLL